MFFSDPLLLNYSVRHLFARKTQVLLTIVGIGLVVFVFLASLMLAEGVRRTLASTGDYQNVIVLSLGAQNEIQSGISREAANIILTQPEVAKPKDGQALSSTDVVVVVTLKKRGDGQTSNVTLRGVHSSAYDFRSQVKLVGGRFPAPGTREIIVGKSVEEKFSGTSIGDSVRLVGTDWPVVGLFEAGNSAFSSEIWGDVDVFMPSFKREQFSSLVFRLAEGADLEILRSRLNADRRLNVVVEREPIFYESQSKTLALFIKIIGIFVSVIFSLGAMIGAMITMYNSVSNRIREIGVLRALGFSRWAVIKSFILECFLIGLLGSMLAIVVSLLLLWVTFSTTNFDTFADLAFGFSITPSIAFQGVLFGVVMGVFGGIIPAVMAGRLDIITALRRQ